MSILVYNLRFPHTPKKQRLGNLFYSHLYTHTYTATIQLPRPFSLQRQQTQMSFTFGNTNTQTFDEHKQAFARQYNGGKQMNYNLMGDQYVNEYVNEWSKKLGKTVDFHENLLKQMFTKIQEQEKKNKIYYEKMISLEHEVGVLASKVECMLCDEQLENINLEEKKNKYIELMKEVRVLEKDLKFN